MAIETEANVTMCAMSESAGERPTARELCNTEDCPIWIAEEEFSEVGVPFILPKWLYIFERHMY